MSQPPPPEQPYPGWDPAQQPGTGQWGQPGYPPGWGPGQPPGWGPGRPQGWGGWVDPHDPLVPAPHAGLSGWSDRLIGVIRRSWRTLLPIVLLTQFLPALVIGVAGLAAPTVPVDSTAGQGLPDLGDVFAFVAALIVLSLAISVVSCVGWAAGTWALTRQAAGEPVGVPAALRYGLSRGVGLWAWTLLVSLLVVAGFCACLLPGIYLAFALSLVGPVYLFERGNPIGRAFQIFHGSLGLVLGRVALLSLIVVGGAVLIELVVGGLGLALGVGEGLTIGAVLVTLVSTLVMTPLYLVQIVGLVTTYAEWRGRQGPVGTGQLVAELG
jgi:hypothetical protein